MKKSPSKIPPASTGAVSGAVAGAVVGSIAGPVGAAAGGIVGGAAGALAGIALSNVREEKAAHDEVLDEEIGVIGGDLGAASPNQPPARVGAYSAGAAGVSTGGGSSAEGLMQNVDE